MVALTTPKVETDFIAPDFSLPGTDGKTYTFDDIKGSAGTVVMFICNHCPYVRSIIERIVRDAKELQEKGIGVVAIMSNDVENYPDDSFENMQDFAQVHGFTFPYLIDETQAVAKAYGAVCTPDFFGFNADKALRYRGRLDASKMQVVPDAKRELFDAMSAIAQTGEYTGEQQPSMGCSIKWKII